MEEGEVEDSPAQTKEEFKQEEESKKEERARVRKVDEVPLRKSRSPEQRELQR